jgi:integrase
MPYAHHPFIEPTHDVFKAFDAVPGFSRAREFVGLARKHARITPSQTLSILRSMIQNNLHSTLVFVVAAIALRSSEVRVLRWADIFWDERRIRIIKSWKKTGVDGDTKTPSSERDVPMGRVLTHHLREWHKQTPYAKPADFVFPSFEKSGRVPICSSPFCADHLRPAAKKAGLSSRMAIAGGFTTSVTASRIGW